MAKLTAEKLQARREKLAEDRRKEDRAVALRVAGATWQQIAADCGWVSPSSAFFAFRRGMERGAPRPDREVMRDLEAERIDRLLLGLWERGIKGDVEAVDRIIKLIQLRARLFGLYEPPQIDIRSTLEDLARKVAGDNDMDAAEIIAIAELHLKDALRG